jgi:drug/metabolite transporter (DMT)-like permease
MISESNDRAMTVSAILLLVSGVTLFGIMDGLGKFLAGEYSVVQVVWARYAFAVPVILATARPAAWSGLLRCERPSLQAARGLLPLLASVTVIVGLRLLPLADATAISFASPLLVVFLSVPLLGERVSVHSWVGVVCGFIRVLLIVRPGAGTIAWAALFPLATAFFFALYQVLTRLVSRRDDPVVTLAWTVAVGLVLTTPLLPAYWHPVGGTDWPLLVLSGLLFGSGQFLLIRAFAMAPAAVLAPFTYAQIVAAVVFGVVVFGDVPDLWTAAGTAVVILAGVYVLRRQAASRAAPVSSYG